MSRPQVKDHELEASDGDRFPKTEEEHGKLVAWCNASFQAADDARKPFENRWDRFYKMYHSYVQRTKGDWRSKVFYPISFWIIETVYPRIMAQLPKFLCKPLRADSVEAAKAMEEALDWTTANARPKLYVEMSKQWKQALKYGTGILKTRYVKDVRVGHRPVPNMVEVKRPQEVPVLDADGLEILDELGNIVTERQEVSLGFIQQGF